MISQKLKYLSVILVLAAAFSLFSCTKSKPTKLDLWIKKAENNVKKYPDSTLFYTHKILSSPSQKGWSEKEQLALYALRQKAFAAIENMDSVVAIGKKIRTLASEISDSLAIANSLLPVRGEIDFSSQQEMAPYFPGAIATFKNYKMPYEAARLNASYGTILCHKGDFVKAQSFLLESYQVFNRLDSIKPIINVCMNIGSTYAYTTSTKKSLEYYKKAYDAALKVNDSNAISSVLMNIGTFYADDIKDQNKAMEYYKRALPFVPKKSGAYLKMKIDYNIAVAAFAKGDFKSSESTFQSMLDDCIKNKSFEGVAMASKGLGDVYIQKNQPDKALRYLTRAVHLADSLEMSYEALQMQPSLLTVYKKNKNFEAALQVSEDIKASTDSILSAEKQNAVQELEIKYQSEKKASEIVHLKSLSNTRQLMLYGLSFFIVVLFFVLRKQKILYKEKQFSYTLLMQQYKTELQKRLFDQTHAVFDGEKEIEAVEEQTENLDLYAQLTAYYEKEKPYLNAKLKAAEVARMLQVPQRTIATTLKEYGHSSFNQFNNKYRVAEVKRQFEDPSCAVLKMEVIASQAGFGNKQSFYTAFEEFTGLNPGFYRAEILK
nr:helix-turn-helix domain-containing protein [uncultured Flavobacterium sp.]